MQKGMFYTKISHRCALFLEVYIGSPSAKAKTVRSMNVVSRPIRSVIKRILYALETTLMDVVRSFV